MPRKTAAQLDAEIAGALAAPHNYGPGYEGPFTKLTKTARVKVLAMLRKLIKSEHARVGPDGFTEKQGQEAAERAIHLVTKALGPLLGKVQLAPQAGEESVEIWNVTGPTMAPEFVINNVTGRVS